MKLLLAFFISNIVLINIVLCQSGVSVNTNGAKANNSAILDVSSTSQGLLIPRMTTAQRNLIASPATSLLIFNTTTNCFEAYVNNSWYSVSCPPPCTQPSSPTVGINTPFTTKIIWNWNTINGATGYKWNTLNNYTSANDNGASTSYTQTGLNCGTSNTLYVWAYNSCGNSSYTILTQPTLVCCGNSFRVTHTSGSIAPVTKTVIYGTASSTLTGNTECWITQNLGADQQATSAYDSTYAAGGWYWEFDLKQGYDYSTSLTPMTWPDSYGPDTNWVSTEDPCNLLLGAGWRIPTGTEWRNVWMNLGGIPMGSTVYTNSGFKLHNAGAIGGPDPSSVHVSDRGDTGYYWSSSQINDTDGLGLIINNGPFGPLDAGKAAGFTLRCINP
jgi:hypothetical protein